MSKIKVILQQHGYFYIHNDLENAAFYFKNRIDSRYDAKDMEGIAHEIMACLTMLAFTVESRFNFLGYKLIDDWKERQPIKDKIKTVARRLNIEADFGKKPFSNFNMLFDFRDTLAHGQPKLINNEKELITTHEELDSRGFLEADWEKFVNQEFLNEIYTDVETIWDIFLKASGLRAFDTVTQFSSSVQFIEHVE